jgi:hypothetical protein
MSPWLLMAISGGYLATAIEQGFTKDWNWLGFWSCYAAANLFYLKATNGSLY